MFPILCDKVALIRTHHHQIQMLALKMVTVKALCTLQKAAKEMFILHQLRLEFSAWHWQKWLHLEDGGVGTAERFMRRIWSSRVQKLTSLCLSHGCERGCICSDVPSDAVNTNLFPPAIVIWNMKLHFYNISDRKTTPFLSIWDDRLNKCSAAVPHVCFMMSCLSCGWFVVVTSCDPEVVNKSITLEWAAMNITNRGCAVHIWKQASVSQSLRLWLQESFWLKTKGWAL